MKLSLMKRVLQVMKSQNQLKLNRTSYVLEISPSQTSPLDILPLLRTVQPLHTIHDILYINIKQFSFFKVYILIITVWYYEQGSSQCITPINIVIIFLYDTPYTTLLASDDHVRIPYDATMPPGYNHVWLVAGFYHIIDDIIIPATPPDVVHLTLSDYIDTPPQQITPYKGIGPIQTHINTPRRTRVTLHGTGFVEGHFDILGFPPTKLWSPPHYACHT